MRGRGWALTLTLAVALGFPGLACRGCAPGGPLGPTVASKVAHADGGKLLAPPPVGLNWPVPAGWVREAFPMPPSFAPGLPKGFEEARVPPGFTDPRAPAFWSWAFAWWFSEGTTLDGPALSQMLEQYVKGLCAQLSGGRLGMRLDRYHAELARVSEPATEAETVAFRGRLDAYDCLDSGRELTLTTRIDVVPCPQSQRRAVIVRLSPQEDGKLPWHDLEERRQDFTCR